MRIRPCSLPSVALVLVAGMGAAEPAVDVELLAGMKARSIGPAGMSGRIAAVTGIPGDRNILYVGAATGGLWKSVDGGLTFDPIFDDQPVAAIGAVTVDPTNHDVVWVGTGEGNLRNSVSIGDGVYKSLDAGRSWTHLGLAESERIHRIHVDPRDGNRAFFGVIGRLWGDGEERGVYRTRDGGKTFERVLYVDKNVGCADLAMDPRNPDKLFAAMYEHRRKPWHYQSGGPKSGLYVTLDGGDTWKKLTPEDGLPEGELGRVGLAIAPSDPSIVYAYIEAKENAIYRSDDGGVSWRKVGSGDNIGNRPFYYADLRVDPLNPLRVYSLWSLVSVSDDGGRTFSVLIPFNDLHPDHHAMWIDPTDANYVIEGNDGGIGISTDRGATWRFAANIPVAQYYHIWVDDEQPYNVYGGMQDNGSWKGPSAVWENGGIRNHHWEEVGFGDGFDTRPHPRDSMIGYAMSQEGYLIRWNLRTGERKDLRPTAAPDGPELRFNWNAGFGQDPFEPDTIYYGSQFLHRSRDRGDTWEVISADLTSNNPDWQKASESGGLTPDVTGAENYTTIITIAPSALQQGLLWIGSDDGRVHVTRDGGQSYQRIDTKAKGVPSDTWVPNIGASPHEAGNAFVVFDNHRRSDFKPYAYAVSNYGQDWKSLVTKDLRGYCLALVQDPVDPQLLFLGTEFGLYVSLDGGSSWMQWKHGVPTVSVMDLAIHARESDLILGTHGRSAFVLDDIRPLREMDAVIAAKPLHLFTPGAAVWHNVKQTGASRFPGATEYRGENRRFGALLNVWLADSSLPHPDDDLERERKEQERAQEAAKAAQEKSESKNDEAKEEADEPKEEIVVTVKDASGKQLRRFTRDAKRGLNRIFWGLESDPFERMPRSDDDDDGGSRSGPDVLPGDYTVTARWGEHEASVPLRVLDDPRSSVPMTDQQANWDLLQRAGKANDLLVAAVHRVRSVQRDLDLVGAKLDELERPWKKEHPDAKPKQSPQHELREALKELRKKLSEADKKLRLPEDTKGYVAERDAQALLGRAYYFASSSREKPTAATVAALEYGEKLVREGIDAVNAVLSDDLVKFREKAGAELLQVLTSSEALTKP